MEEIDIIELLKRVKEGNAPKEIEVEGTKHYLDDNAEDISGLYKDSGGYEFLVEYITFDTKIKILDKPIIEELGYELDLSVNGLIKPTEYEKNLGNCIIANAKKINEIIRYLRDKEEK